MGEPGSHGSFSFALFRSDQRVFEVSVQGHDSLLQIKAFLSSLKNMLASHCFHALAKGLHVENTTGSLSLKQNTFAVLQIIHLSHMLHILYRAYLPAK